MQVDQEMLFEIILASNYLDIKPLLDVGCKTVANMIKGSHQRKSVRHSTSQMTSPLRRKSRFAGRMSGPRTVKFGIRYCGWVSDTTHVHLWTNAVPFPAIRSRFFTHASIWCFPPLCHHTHCISKVLPPSIDRKLGIVGLWSICFSAFHVFYIANEPTAWRSGKSGLGVADGRTGVYWSGRHLLSRE